MIVGEVNLVRGALAAVLANEDDLQVISELSLREDVLAAARTHRPGVVVLDLDGHGAGGVELAGRLAGDLPGCRLMVLTGQRAPEVLRRVLAVGVWALLSVDTPPAQVVQAIRLVATGERVVEPALAVAALRTAANPLTERECAVLRLAAEGLRSREIAERLYLSPGTVRNYLSAAMRKTGARNRLEAVHRAGEAGWL
jgi:two-component system response regulator DesR